MKFRCKDIRLTILGVWVVLFLSFFNRLLTTFFLCFFFLFCMLSVLRVTFFLLWHIFMFSYFLTILILLPVLPFYSRAIWFPVSNIYSFLSLGSSVSFSFIILFHLKTPSLLTVMEIFTLLYFSTFFPLSLSFLCLSLSGAFQSFSLYDQLQAGRTLLLCDRADREHAVGSRSC